MISIMKKPPRAYSYIRFSSAAQAEGDSVRRQLDKAAAYATKHGLALATTDMMRDEGLSGFTGRNITDGALGRFIDAVDNGKIETGSYLLVEAHDRLSRMEPSEALLTLLKIVKRGIVVVTLEDEMVFSHPVDTNKLLLSIFKMQAANQESERKRQFSTNNWSQKRKDAAKGQRMTKVRPGWLDEDFKPIPERAALVKRIYDLSLTGHGIYTIAKILNAEGIPAFRSDSWQTSTVAKILRNKATIGEFQPNIRDRTAPGGRVPAGEPISKYYPPIISEADFYASQAATERRKAAGVGRNGKRYANIFTGILYCAECDSKMYVNQHNKRASSKIIYCRQVENGKCDAKAWQYNKFERSLLSFVNEIELQSIIEGSTGSRAEIIDAELRQLEGEKQDIESKLSRLVELYESNDAMPLNAVNSKIQQHQARLSDIKSRTEAHIKERNDIHNSRRKSMEQAVISFPENISDEELYTIRAKAAEHIRGVIESITLSKPNALIAARAKKLRDEAKTLDERNWWEHNRAVFSRKSSFDSKYMIKFKGGGIRIVHPDSHDPKEAWIVVNMGFADRDNLPKVTKTMDELRTERGLAS